MGRCSYQCETHEAAVAVSASAVPQWPRGDRACGRAVLWLRSSSAPAPAPLRSVCPDPSYKATASRTLANSHDPSTLSCTVTSLAITLTISLVHYFSSTPYLHRQPQLWPKMTGDTQAKTVSLQLPSSFKLNNCCKRTGPVCLHRCTWRILCK